MSSLFDALEKLKNREDVPNSIGAPPSSYGRDTASVALNITPETVSRIRMRRRILALLMFVVAPVTVAYVAHVYDETVRSPGEKPFMNRVVAFVAGEDGVKDYVRQGVGSARTATVGTLDRLVGDYGKLPVADTVVQVPPPAQETVSPPVPKGTVVEDLAAGGGLSLPQASSATPALPVEKTVPPSAPAISLPSAPPVVSGLDLDQLINDLAMPDGDVSFSPPLTGVPLPSGDAGIPAHVEMARGKLAPLSGEDAALSVSYRKSIHLRTLYDSAHAALDAGDNQQAINLFSQILAQDAEDRVARFALAIAQQKSGLHADAVASYDRLLALDPQNLDARANRFSLLATEKPQEARAGMEGLMQANPDFANGWACLSDLYARQGLDGMAIAARQRVIALRPGNVSDLYNLAVLQDRAGNRDAAISAYRAVLRAAGRNHPGLPVDDIRLRLEYLVR